MYCKHCGALVDEDSLYCSNCGNKINRASNKETLHKYDNLSIKDNNSKTINAGNHNNSSHLKNEKFHWYDSKLLTYLVMIFFPPLAIIMLVLNNRFKESKIVFLLILSFLLSLFYLSNIFNTTNNIDKKPINIVKNITNPTEESNEVEMNENEKLVVEIMGVDTNNAKEIMKLFKELSIDNITNIEVIEASDDTTKSFNIVFDDNNAIVNMKDHFISNIFYNDVQIYDRISNTKLTIFEARLFKDGKLYQSGIDKLNKDIMSDYIYNHVIRLGDSGMRKPDMVGGVDFDIDVKNMSVDEIKYVRFNIYVYNAVGDVISSDLDYIGDEGIVLELVGPVKQNEIGGLGRVWNGAFYNSTAKSWAIKTIEIEYMNGRIILIDGSVVSKNKLERQ